jgi:hypothetical protein
MAAAVCEAGALGSLPCAMLSVEAMRAELDLISSRTVPAVQREFLLPRPARGLMRGARAAWREVLAPYYAEFGIDASAIPAGPGAQPIQRRGRRRARGRSGPLSSASTSACRRRAPRASQVVGLEGDVLGPRPWRRLAGSSRERRRGGRAGTRGRRPPRDVPQERPRDPAGTLRARAPGRSGSEDPVDRRRAASRSADCGNAPRWRLARAACRWGTYLPALRRGDDPRREPRGVARGAPRYRAHHPVHGPGRRAG